MKKKSFKETPEANLVYIEAHGTGTPPPPEEGMIETSMSQHNKPVDMKQHSYSYPLPPISSVNAKPII